MTRPTVLIIGYGYSASFIGQNLKQQGYRVIGTSRSITTAQTGECELIPFDLDHITPIIETAQALLISAPPNHQGEDSVYTLLAPLLKSKAHALKWLGYLSSTGVYGDHQGQWVDETTPPSPQDAIGQARLKAEQAWLSLYHQHQLPIHIFRLSGIYGPHRNPLERLLSGKKSVYVKANQYFSRIHVEDIALIVHASLCQPTPGEIFNVSDDLPTPPEQVYDYAAQCLSLPPLARILIDDDTNINDIPRFYCASRKVCNDKIKQCFALTLTYPTYQHGLDHLYSDMNSTP